MNRQEKRALHEQCGAKRKSRSRLIRAFLLMNGHTLTSIAEQEGITIQAVCNVVNGRKHTPKVLDAILAAGVPSEHLADPRQEMRNAK